jgi:hypothetical protein
MGQLGILHATLLIQIYSSACEIPQTAKMKRIKNCTTSAPYKAHFDAPSTPNAMQCSPADVLERDMPLPSRILRVVFHYLPLSFHLLFLTKNPGFATLLHIPPLFSMSSPRI